MGSEGKTVPAEKDDHLTQQLNTLMNLYKHHLDLFWKWITLYVSIITAVSAYMFNKDLLPSTRQLFPVLIAVASLGIAFGCFIMWSWLKELQKEVTRISDEIKSYQYPSFLGMRMTKAALVASLLFAAFNILYSMFGNFEF